MRTLIAAMVLLPVLAHAEDGFAKPGADPWSAQPASTGERLRDAERNGVPVAASNESPYWSSCRHIWARAPYVRVDPFVFSGSVSAPAPSSGGSSSGGSSGGSLSGLGSGGGGPEALLVIAVVALAALPFIVYAVDSEADPLTLERFYCPELSFSAMGGVQLGNGGPGNPAVSGLGVTKLRLDIGYVGAQAEVGINPAFSGTGGLGSFAAHFLLRPVPKAHVEGALAIGARRATGPGGTLDGLELALPHMYVFSRDGYRKLGLEVNPRVFWNRRGFDVGVDLGVAIPVADVLQVRVGAGVFSHAFNTQFTASAGLTAHL